MDSPIASLKYKKLFPRPRTSAQIRCNYFGQLGIVPSCPPKWDQALKYDDDTCRKNIISARRHPRQQPERRIRFHSLVTVHTIASHNDYTEEIRNSLWTNTDEIMARRKRSSIEFRYDGWDWRTVSEEEDMYIDRYTGEFIHPAHVVLPGKTWEVQLPKYEDYPKQESTLSPTKRYREKTRNSQRRNPTIMENQQQQQSRSDGLSLTRFADT